MDGDNENSGVVREAFYCFHCRKDAYRIYSLPDYEPYQSPKNKLLGAVAMPLSGSITSNRNKGEETSKAKERPQKKIYFLLVYQFMAISIQSPHYL